MEVMFYVQHLLGVGHVMRSAAIVRALARQGVGVAMVLGGFPVKFMDLGGAQIFQLPPVRAMDSTFKPLYGENAKPINDAWRESRRRRLLAIFNELRPRVLAIELFPFGRRQFGFELEPLLEAAKAASPRPQIVCSVRDILVANENQERNLEIVNQARANFDVILAHGDAKFIPFAASFPLADRLEGKLRHTGYVAAGYVAAGYVAAGYVAASHVAASHVAASHVADQSRDAKAFRHRGQDEVIVSVGGGFVGEELLRTALMARPLCSLRNARWRLLVGHNLPEERFLALLAAAKDGFIVERARPDFPILLANCKLSISQGGYNTVMEIIAAKAKSVIVPFAGGGENEQAFRARKLEKLGLTLVLDEARLTKENLAAAADLALELPPFPDICPMDLNGAEVSAEIIANLAKIV